MLGPWAMGVQEAWDWCEANIVPVDCYGTAGTVVFYHNKLGHMAGNNYGAAIRRKHTSHRYPAVACDV